MTLKMIGAVFIVLLILVIFGNVWFYFVDGLIERVRSQKPENWHTLEDTDEKNPKN